MESKEIVELLKKAGYSNDKTQTRLHTFDVVKYSSFLTEQVYNRANAGWKTAQFIVVKDCEDLNKLLFGFRNMCGNYNNQFLVVCKNGYVYVYNSLGKCVGNEDLFNNLK